MAAKKIKIEAPERFGGAYHLQANSYADSPTIAGSDRKPMTKKVVPKDFTYLETIPASYVYTFRYISEREMTAEEQNRIQDTMAECGYSELVDKQVIVNDFEEACSILRQQARQLDL